MMRSIKTVVGAAVFAAWTIPALAGPLDGVGSGASDLAGVSEASAYETKLHDLDALWDAMPLAAHVSLLVTGPVKTYGSFDPRPGNEYKASEKVVSYIEPVGYVFKDEDGILAYGFTVDLTVRKEDGSTLFQKNGYGTLASRSRSRKREIEFDSSLGIEGVAPGTYTLEFLFHDSNSAKTMLVKQVFKVVG